MVIADKGYDSESNHELIHRYNANSIIPVRRNAIKGKYRLDMKSNWDKYKKIYYQRNKVEAVISVIKRIFDDNIRSKRVVAENRELMFRMIAYNAYRLSIILLIVIIQVLMVSTQPRS
ncbi:MAG: hypothetical protein KatS3mg003_0712 [Candidatus Nitrosocaldaceae archaeon]|nr:MAG: hypothetical protein KatS3mg003_0712 [Candidatus Nitrosocaldaceae archaeon]